MQPQHQRESVVITFSEDGPGVTVEAVGVKGRSCTELTRPFEEALGVAAKRTLKPEYNAVAAGAVAKVGGGR